MTEITIADSLRTAYEKGKRDGVECAISVTNKIRMSVKSGNLDNTNALDEIMKVLAMLGGEE